MRALASLAAGLASRIPARKRCIFTEERRKQAEPDRPVYRDEISEYIYTPIRVYRGGGGRGKKFSDVQQVVASVAARVNADRASGSFQAYQKAVRSNRGDLRVALAESSKQLTPQSGPRVIQHTTRSNKVIDTEKTLEKKELKADGLIVTEKKRTVEHEEVSLNRKSRNLPTRSPLFSFLASLLNLPSLFRQNS